MSDRPFRPSARSISWKRVTVGLVGVLAVGGLAAAVWQLRDPDRQTVSKLDRPLPGEHKAPPAPPIPPDQQPDSPEPVPPVPPALKAQIVAACGGTADPALVETAARRFGDRARDAAEAARVPGLMVLTKFGPDAEELLVADRESFGRLAGVGELSELRLNLAAGPWRDYVLRWARDARHERARQFVDRLRQLPDDRVEIATKHPAALPLLFAKAPSAHAAIAEQGEPALQVLLSVDATGHPEALEFVGRRLREEKRRIPAIAERYGPAAAFLLIGPMGTDDKARALPDIVWFALESKKIGQEEVLALFLTALPAVLEDLRAGVAPQRIKDAFTRFAGLDDLVRMLAADHPLTLRLLAEEGAGNAALGVRVMERCGPEAADFLYGDFAAPEVRPAVLATLATVGWGGKDEPVFGLLRELSRDGDFLAFLKRGTSEKLHEGVDPLLPRGVLALANASREGQKDIMENFTKTENLRGQLEKLLMPRDDGIWEWVPGYTAVTTIQDYRNGLRVTRRDVFLAGLDAADAVLTVASLGTSSAATAPAKAATTGAKVVGKRVGKEALEEGAKRLAKNGTRAAASQADDALRRVLARAPHLEKLGAQGTKAATLRATARGQGIAAHSLWDGASLEKWGTRAKEWAKREAVEWVTDVPGRSLDFAKLSVTQYPKVTRWIAGVAADGAAQYARAAGYLTVHVETIPQTHWLNHVFKDGDRTVVIEAVAPGLGYHTLDGFEQGTIEYVGAVARRVRDGNAPEELKKVAGDVLQAIAEKKLDVETVATDHAAGIPTLVRVIRAVGPNGEIRPEVAKDFRAVPGWAVALLTDYRIHAGTWSVGSWLRYQSGVASRLGIPVWPQTGAQTPAAFRVGGKPDGRLVRELPAGHQIGLVSEFAAALAELFF